MELELLAVFLGWHKKYVTNNIRFIKNGRFGFIHLPSFPEIYFLGMFVFMGDFFLLVLS